MVGEDADAPCLSGVRVDTNQVGGNVAAGAVDEQAGDAALWVAFGNGVEGVLVEPGVLQLFAEGLGDAPVQAVDSVVDVGGGNGPWGVGVAL